MCDVVNKALRLSTAWFDGRVLDWVAIQIGHGQGGLSDLVLR